MKKIVISLGLTLGLALSSFSQIISPAVGSTPFLTGSGMILSNNTTYTFGDLGIIYIGSTNQTSLVQGGTPYPVAYYSQSNISIAPTITNGPGLIQAGVYYTNAAVAYASSVPLQGGLVTNANTLYGNPWKDVTVPLDKNGNVAAIAIAEEHFGMGANSSNTVKYIFVPVVDGVAITNAQNQFQFTSGASVLNLAPGQSGIMTNVLTVFQQGVGTLRLYQIIVSSVSSSQGIFVNRVNLQGPQ